MGSKSSKKFEFTYDCFTTNEKHFIVLRLANWRDKLYVLMEKAFSENELQVEKDVFIWTLVESKKKVYSVYFGTVDYLGWNMAMEISGPCEHQVNKLDAYIGYTLRHFGVEFSPRIGEDETYDEAPNPAKIDKNMIVEFN